MGAIPLNTSVASGVVLARSQGGVRMLLLNRAKDRFWCHVAGKIEEGESAWQAIVREIDEETGIVVSELYTAEFLEQFYEPKRNCITVIPVFVTYVLDSTPVVLNEEHTEFGWFSIEEAKNMVPYPNQVALYEHIKRYFVDAEPSEHMRVCQLTSQVSRGGLSAAPA